MTILASDGGLQDVLIFNPIRTLSLLLYPSIMSPVSLSSTT